MSKVNTFEQLNSNRHEQVLLVLAKQNVVMTEWINALTNCFDNNDSAKNKTEKLKQLAEDLYDKLLQDYTILDLQEKMEKLDEE